MAKTILTKKDATMAYIKISAILLLMLIVGLATFNLILFRKSFNSYSNVLEQHVQTLEADRYLNLIKKELANIRS